MRYFFAIVIIVLIIFIRYNATYLNQKNSQTLETTLLKSEITIATPNLTKTNTPSEPKLTLLSNPNSNNQHFTQFIQLQQIVLRTPQKQKKYEIILQDKQLLGKAVFILQQSNNFSFSTNNERFIAINFLSEALTTKDRIQLNFIVSKIEDILLSDGYDVPETHKKYFIGDKMELYIALLQNDPIKAEEILKKAHNTLNEKIFMYAIGYFNNKKEGV